MQRIRFCQGLDGVRLAYAVSGEGAPLVRTPQWFTHLEHEPRNPIWRPWIEAGEPLESLRRRPPLPAGKTPLDMMRD